MTASRFARYDQGSRKPPRRWWQWSYSVYLPDRDCCHSFTEAELQPTGEFDLEVNHLGKRHEISFDTVNQADVVAIEGCYRMPGRFWEVFVFITEDVSDLRHELVTWPSGITGVQFDVPMSVMLNDDYVKRSMCDAFGADAWAVVYGPESLLLK